MSKYDHLVPQLQKLRDAGLGWRRIATETGIPATTVRRLLNPQYAEVNRRAAQRYKARRVQPCATPGCPNLARYAGKPGLPVSRYCSDCGHEHSKTTKRARAITREQAATALREFAAAHGRTPTSIDFLRKGSRPSHMTIHRLFGSWDAALIAAGLEPRRYHRSRAAA